MGTNEARRTREVAEWSRMNWHSKEGCSSPLGTTWIEDEDAFNFALYSKLATGVDLLLYSELDQRFPAYEYRLDPFANKSGHVWHCRVKANVIPRAHYYGYRVLGPDARSFDPQKVLLDPYAKCVCFPTKFSRDAACYPGSNAGKAPLGLLRREEAAIWKEDRAPEHSADLVIYELHVRGFTRRDNSRVTPQHRGTFMGLVEKIPYLKELGITAVELLPIAQQDPQGDSYWGYMPLNFFSPHHEYASAHKPFDALHEFRLMVGALHDAGIELLLDVVYNHTAEGGALGPTYSYRGIDMESYYLLEEDGRSYQNDSGTGNTMRCADPAVRRLILDAVRFWREEMHVDGFRFDLASIFARDDRGRVNIDNPPVIAELSSAPELENLRLIAEAWDPASYQLGTMFPGINWLQWNGRFRDDVRSFVRGDAGMVGHLMSRLYGSSDLFPDDITHSYRPYQSVNFISCHDGFCLSDLVSYDCKHNLANGQGNRDGPDNNLSWNCGWEGNDGVPSDVMLLRKQQVKNFCCLLMLSNGTPMFAAGDEFMNTQNGNNNPYNQDNEVTWLDWELLQKNSDIFRFFRCMIAFRKAHPSLSRSRYWRDDVKWYGTHGPVDMSHNSRTLAFLLHGASQGDLDIYVMINGSAEDTVFELQKNEGTPWHRVVDTGATSPDDFREQEQQRPVDSADYTVAAHSVVVLIHG